MIVRLVLASLRRRFRQMALILAAVAVAAATVAALAAFSTRAERRLAANLAAFGPNLTVRPQVGGRPAMPPDALERIRRLPDVQSASAPDRRIATEAWPGSGAAPKARAGPGAGAAPETGRAAGPGGAAGASGLARIEVRAEPERLARVAHEIEAEVEGVEAVPLLRVSESDARVTRRLTLVLIAVAAVSTLLALLSVGAATTALLGERRTEVGLLLALGYTSRRVGLFFGAELLVAALLAAVAGEVAGELGARALAQRAFGDLGAAAGTAAQAALPAAHGALPVTWAGFAAAAGVAVTVVAGAIALVLSRLERLDAASVLRGD
jgi:hypothetical protein